MPTAERWLQNVNAGASVSPSREKGDRHTLRDATREPGSKPAQPSGWEINLQDNTITDDEDLAGDGTFGAFTFHGLRADALTPDSPVPPTTCATPAFFPVVNGAGVFRFDDGSLLVVNITGGGICIDFAVGVAQLDQTYEIARGTGRFKRASGTLHSTVTVIPVLFNAEGAAQWLTMSGQFEGNVSGISRERDRPGGRQNKDGEAGSRAASLARRLPRPHSQHRT